MASWFPPRTPDFPLFRPQGLVFSLEHLIRTVGPLSAAIHQGRMLFEVCQK